MGKEKPHVQLLDAVSFNWGNIKLNGKKQIEANRFRAKRFVFSDDSSHRLGEIIRDTEGLMLKSFQFAIPPYPVTYVEINGRLMQKGMDRPLHGGDLHQDERVGFLVIKDSSGNLTVHVMASGGPGDADPEVLVSAFIYRWSEHGVRSMTMPSRLRFTNDGKSEFGDSLEPEIDFAKIAVLLGSTANAIDPDDVSPIKYVDQTWGLFPAYDMPKAYERPHLFLSSAGDLRTLLALLLVLNQPKHIRVTPVGRSSGMRRNKRVVYAAHNTVEITLGETKDYPRMWDARPSDRPTPRRHDVRGHFRHYRIDQNCTHSWPLFPSRPTDGGASWECQSCGGLRVWVREHQRGDATRGYVTKDYTLL